MLGSDPWLRASLVMVDTTITCEHRQQYRGLHPPDWGTKMRHRRGRAWRGACKRADVNNR